MYGLRRGALIIYIATGVAFLAFSAVTGNAAWLVPVGLVAAGYLIGVLRHASTCPHPKKMTITAILLTILTTIAAATATWFINHELGYGAMVASGFIGVLAGVTLAEHLAGAAYTASFVGMSATMVLPSPAAATVAGAVVGIIIVISTPVFRGIGGKGGTAAAAAVLMTAAFVFTVGM